MMAQKELRKRAFKAWAKASLVCAFASPFIFFLGELLDSTSSEPPGSLVSQTGFILAISAVAAVVHLIAFALIGLPFFLCFYGQAHAALWKWIPGSLMGTALGAIIVPLVLAPLYDRPLEQDLLLTASGGALYGVLTAFASILNRPGFEQAAES